MKQCGLYCLLESTENNEGISITKEGSKLGLYDEIVVKKPCLKCNKIIETLQTKATACTMETYKIGDILPLKGYKIIDGSIEVHGICPSCDSWHDGEARIKNQKLIEIVNLRLDKN